MRFGSLLLVLAPATIEAASICPHQVHTEQCASLIMKKTMQGFSNDDCDCHDFCDGEYVGCSDNNNENPLSCQGLVVRGCSFRDLANDERSLQTATFGAGGFQDNCPQGSFQSVPGNPCVACLSCSANAKALVTCVKNAADTAQCECLPGFRSNGRGGCPPDRSGVASGSLGACPAGQYRSSPDPNAPCVDCLNCPWNSSPTTTCVTNAVTQCQCNSGYTSNGQGGCLPTPNVGGGSLGRQPQPCAEGYYRSSPDANAPCTRCLQCPWNATPQTTCVTNAAAQCQCNSGYTSNGRGGCLPTPNVGGGSLGRQPQPCAEGYYRSSPDANAPCTRCLQCPWNATPQTTCVTNAAAQCQCNSGYTSNGRGGCLPTPNVGGGSLGGGQQACEVGFYRSSADPNAPCIQCLRCPWNASPTTNCVRNAGDPAQCQCNSGYVSNGRGGCLPVSNVGEGSVGGTPAACEVGFFRSSPQASAPCVPCLRCPLNSDPATNCVRNTADPAQCVCRQGFAANGRGGCLPVSTRSFEAQQDPDSGTSAVGGVVMSTATALFTLYLYRW